MLRGLLLLLVILGAGAVAIQRLATDRREAGWRRLQAKAAEGAQNEGLQELLSARVTGLRVTLAEPEALDVIAELAFVSASLAHHYGLPTWEESAGLLARLEGKASSDEAAATAGAARALLALDRGKRAEAERLA